MCAARLDPDYFVKTVLERFHVLDLLTFDPAGAKSPYIEPDKQTPMMEAALTLIGHILTFRHHLGKLLCILTLLEQIFNPFVVCALWR